MDDPTYNNVPAYLWTCSELITVNICAAAPAVRSFTSRVKKEIRTIGSSQSSRNQSGSGRVRFAGVKVLSLESNSQQESIPMVHLFKTGGIEEQAGNGCTEEKLMDIKINWNVSTPRRQSTVTNTIINPRPSWESKPLPSLPHSPSRQSLSPSEYEQNATEQR